MHEFRRRLHEICLSNARARARLLKFSFGTDLRSLESKESFDSHVLLPVLMNLKREKK